MKIDYIKDFFENFWHEKRKPKMLLHACCAPCATEVIARLSEIFDLTLYFYNPNIFPEAEFLKRFDQFKKLKTSIKILMHPYNYEEFEEMIAGYEDYPEGSERCYECFYGRLTVVAKAAAQNGFDCFCTTLSISPHKSSALINKAGLKVEEEQHIKYLQSDFKKQNGFLNSIRRAKELGLYRQNYCGCKKSLEESLKRIEKHSQVEQKQI